MPEAMEWKQLNKRFTKALTMLAFFFSMLFLASCSDSTPKPKTESAAIFNSSNAVHATVPDGKEEGGNFVSSAVPLQKEAHQPVLIDNSCEKKEDNLLEDESSASEDQEDNLLEDESSASEDQEDKLLSLRREKNGIANPDLLKRPVLCKSDNKKKKVDNKKKKVDNKKKKVDNKKKKKEGDDNDTKLKIQFVNYDA